MKIIYAKYVDNILATVNAKSYNTLVGARLEKHGKIKYKNIRILNFKIYKVTYS